MSLDLARRIGRALNIRNETAIRTVDQALQAYVRLTPQSETTPMTGSIDAAQVTSGEFVDARVAESNVTQHEAALELDALQVGTGSFADARIQQSSVTQHQAALSIAETQIPDGGLLARLGADETVNGGWNFAGFFRLSGIVADAILADQNDYAPTGLAAASVLRLTPDAARSITGIAGGGEGRLLIVMNASGTGANTLTLPHNSAASILGNRFLCPRNLDVVLDRRASAVLHYDSGAGFWRFIAPA